jgi:cytosine/adenosine deaminase-related metal-dependent hydrolase
MKISLFSHPNDDLLTLAQKLWRGVTSDAAEALRLNCGKIMTDYDGDFLVMRVNYPINEQLPIHLINQPRVIESIYIQGEKVQ